MFCEVLSCKVLKPCELKVCPAHCTSQSMNCLLYANQTKEFTLEELIEILPFDVEKVYNSGMLKCLITTLKINTVNLTKTVYPKDRCVETGDTKLSRPIALGHYISDRAMLPPSLWSIIVILSVDSKEFANYLLSSFKDFELLEQLLNLKKVKNTLINYLE